MHENLIRIQPLVQKILCTQESVTEFSVVFFVVVVFFFLFFFFFTSVTLKLVHGHQNLISSLLCPNNILMQIW